MASSRIATAIHAVLLLAASCGGVAQAAPPQERELVITNRGASPITELHVSSSQTDDWGEDRLAGGPLKPGGSLHLHLGRGRDCLFDVIVSYPDGRQEETDNFNVCAGAGGSHRQLAFDGSAAQDPAAADSHGEAHEVTLIDHTSLDIAEVYLSPAAASQWGDDQLARSGLPDPALPAGGSARFTLHGGCQADLRVVFENKAAEERRDLNICARPSVTISPGWTTREGPEDDAAPTPPRASASLTLRNASHRAIAEFYAYPDGAEAHGPDLLGSLAAPDGSTTQVAVDLGHTCRFTLRAVLEGHAADLVRSGIDLCATHEVTMTDQSRDARNVP